MARLEGNMVRKCVKVTLPTNFYVDTTLGDEAVQDINVRDLVEEGTERLGPVILTAILPKLETLNSKY